MSENICIFRVSTNPVPNPLPRSPVPVELSLDGSMPKPSLAWFGSKLEVVFVVPVAVPPKPSLPKFWFNAFGSTMYKKVKYTQHLSYHEQYCKLICQIFVYMQMLLRQM